MILKSIDEYITEGGAARKAFFDQFNLNIEFDDDPNSDMYKFNKWVVDNAKEVSIDSAKKQKLKYNNISINHSECFVNSLNIVSSISGAKYILGYIITNDALPVPHAWVSIKGKYYDLTLEKFNESPKLYTYMKLAEFDKKTAIKLDAVKLSIGNEEDYTGMSSIIPYFTKNILK